MRRTARRRPSKLALTLSLFFLSSLAAATSTPGRRSWRPDSELPGAPFVLGDGKNEGSKVKGYEGEWPLWSSFRKSKSAQNAGSSPTPVAAAAASGGPTHVCAPIGECEPCPDNVIHLPYCRPYNNRRRVACSPISNPNDPHAIQAALANANAAKSTSTSTSATTAALGYEACGKSAKQEARDYFEMIAVITSIAIFSVWAFIQRQKLLFQRQNQQLQSRVTGQRRASGVLPPPSPAASRTLKGNRKMRAARLAPASR
ncbi:uncharacterized protein SPSC_05179 [Sporisorium scitamineum]|uniref:Uncharacterized protein n=1 Tax=Sporisorium scitamineum TaxID=49012 RepID=A0A0F7S214_9BASI|nr:hypothetical protein [Sporisorium scitamineum]CDU25345.1 uncharacterized protein SPSC_05179 [Sporisorium scitamineum]